MNITITTIHKMWMSALKNANSFLIAFFSSRFVLICSISFLVVMSPLAIGGSYTFAGGRQKCERWL